MLNELSANISSTFRLLTKPEKKSARLRENKIRELISNIEHTKTEMNLAMENFNNVTEPKLIDSYIYKIQSEQAKFEHLLSEYKAIQTSSVLSAADRA